MICPTCRLTVDAASGTCPRCGQQMRGKPRLKRGLPRASFLIGAFGLIWALGIMVFFSLVADERALLASLFTIPLFLSPALGLGVLAVGLGIVALNRIRARPNEYAGRQDAVRGLTCGVLTWLALPACYFVMLLSAPIAMSLANDARAREKQKAFEGPCEGLLHLLASNPDSGVVRKWLKRHQCTTVPSACLCQAVHNNRMEAVMWLVGHGADPNTYACWYDSTPLSEAVAGSREPIVAYLLAHGADPNLNRSQIPPIVTAARNAQPFIVRMLIANGANVNAHSNKFSARGGWTALHAVMRWEQNRGWTPLSDYYEVIDALLASGADPTIRDDKGLTALHVAVENGFVEGAAHLLEVCDQLPCSASPINATDAEGRTALDFARNTLSRLKERSEIERCKGMITMLSSRAARAP